MPPAEEMLPEEEIAFATSVLAEVKGHALDDGKLEDFGVFAAKGDRSETVAFPDDPSLTGFMDNVRVKKQNDGTWSSEPEYYWPVAYDVTFFAYAPYLVSGTGGNEFSADWTGKKLSLTYTPDANPKNQVDFLVASEPALDKYREQISFEFEHALTWVTFSAAYVGDLPDILPDNTYIRIDELELRGVVKANTVTLTAGGYSWDAIDEAVPRDAAYVLSLNGTTLGDVGLVQNEIDDQSPEFTEFVAPDGAMFLLPQDIDPASASLGVTFSFVDGDNKEIISQFYSEKKLPSASWVMSKKIRYNLTLDISTASLIEVSAVQGGTWIHPWEDSGNAVPDDKPEIQ